MHHKLIRTQASDSSQITRSSFSPYFLPVTWAQIFQRTSYIKSKSLRFIACQIFFRVVSADNRRLHKWQKIKQN